MINFFRDIRKSLLFKKETGKPALPAGRYLKYAIGEILLVVIGILIALQINNWNEERKIKIYELEQLREIKENLQEAKIEIDNDMKFNSLTVKMYKRILNHMNSDLPYDKSLDSAFFLFTNWQSPFLPKNGYETLKSSGINIIENQKLKKEIIKMYEQNFEFLVNDTDKGEWFFNSTVTTPFSAKFIKYFNDADHKYAQPNDYEALKKNPEFENILRILIRKREAGIRHYKKSSEDISNLITMIDIELKNRINKENQKHNTNYE